jgi:ABC-type branched-subunit amino acid transport system substrate-binding protein
MDLSNPTPAMKEVIDRWQAKYKEPFVSDTILAWDESWMLVQAMRKAGSVDPAKVVAAFDLMTEPGSLQTVFGPARMGGAQRFGVNRVLVRPIPISTIMKGKIGLDGLHMPAIE